TRGRAIEGTVVDAASGAPLGGARVVFGAWEGGDLAWDDGAFTKMVDRQDAVTGADGGFRVREGEPGTLFVRREGYARRALTAAEWRGLLDASGRMQVGLEAGATLRGVLFEDGAPSRRGFLVLFRSRSPGLGAEREWIGNLDRDAEGRYRAEDLPPGEYCLEHWRETPGKRTAGLSLQRPVRLRAGEEQVLDFGADLGPLSFQGRLLGPEGRPFDRARLTLRPESGGAYSEFAATADAEHEGRFHFLGLRPGRYRVEVVDRRGKRAALEPLEIEADLERDLEAAVE
ncbi:MAG: carboxypeptidase-like regulatory domain-containing protein, partial [Candidatus Methylomirabilales bacterium]